MVDHFLFQDGQFHEWFENRITGNGRGDTKFSGDDDLQFIMI